MDNFLLKLKCFFLPCQENEFKPFFLRSRFLGYYAALLLILKFAVIPLLICLPKTNFFADVTKTALIKMANSDRQEKGIAPLVESEILDQAALLKAQDMLANDYFAHTSPLGTEPWYWFGQAGYDYRYAGENLAIGFLESEEVNQAWLDSASHRKNILNGNYTEIGLAVLSGEFEGHQTTVVVQLFGKPASSQVAVVQNQLTAVLSELEQNVTTSQTATQQNDQPKEVLSAYHAAQKDDWALRLFTFLASDYFELIQKIIMVSLILIILLLLNTVLFDIFVYRAYEIQHGDMLLKTVGFCLTLAILWHFDKGSALQLIPHDLKIY
jgi:hypothetical protein